LALILALSGLALAEEDAELVILPEQEIAAEDQDGPELDVEGLDAEELDADPLDDLSLDLGLDEALDLSEDLVDPDEAAEAEPDDSIQDNGELADNDWYEWHHVDLRYIDAKGKQMDTVNCWKLMGRDDNDLSNGWYAVIGNVTYSESIYVRGNANLILCDGSKLTAKDGICVEKDAKLTIWVQSHNEKTRGKLVARDPNRKAGIGGIGNAAAGAITINGGDINTKGGREYAGITADVVTINNGKVYACGENGGAGIGGNNEKDGGKVKAESKSTVLPVGAGIGGGSGGNCNDVTITGGDVTGQSGIGYDGRPGAGIGGGQKGNLVGTVTIKGGRVVASGSDGSAGIGGGWAGNALQGHVNISGGRVIAKGVNGGAGIGGGRGDGDNNNIGGQGSHVSITGTADVIALTITTKRYSRCSAIGHGHNNKEYGTITFGDNMMVQADWSNKAGEAGEPFPWDNRQGGCFYRWYAHIRPCDHRNATYSNITEKTHTVNACKYCKQGGRQEAHNFDPKTGKCRQCGYQRKKPKPTVTPTPTPATVTITFDSNGGDGRMAPQEFDPRKAVKLNANTFTCRWNTFKGWNTRRDGSGTAYADGATVKLKGNITLYAQWYVNVIIMAYRRQVKWTGKPQSVKGYSVILESDTDYVVKDAVFPGVTASCTATDIGIYPVEVKGAIVNKTTDRDGVYIVTGIRDGTLMILKPDATFTVKPRAKKLTYNGKY